MIRTTYYIICTLVNYTIPHSTRPTALTYATVRTTKPGDIAKATGIEELGTPYIADLRIVQRTV